MLHNIEKDYPVIWLDDILCPNSTCKPERDGALIYRDASHLSYEGSRWLGQKLDIYNLAKQLANK